MKAQPSIPPFVCSFDTYSQQGLDACNGIDYTTTNDAKLTTLEVDPLPGSQSTYITDFTSIGNKN